MRSALFMSLFGKLAHPAWWAVEFPPDSLSVGLVRAVIREGPIEQP